MPEMKLSEVVTQAKTDGWKVTPVTRPNGSVVYQLFDPAGEYIASGLTEAQAVKRALYRGFMSVDADSGRKVRRNIKFGLEG